MRSCSGAQSLTSQSLFRQTLALARFPQVTRSRAEGTVLSLRLPAHTATTHTAQCHGVAMPSCIEGSSLRRLPNVRPGAGLAEGGLCLPDSLGPLPRVQWALGGQDPHRPSFEAVHCAGGTSGTALGFGSLTDSSPKAQG